MEEIFGVFMGFIGVAFSLIMTVGLIVLIIFFIQKNQKKNEVDRHSALRNRLAVQELVGTLPQDKQAIFMMEYNSRKKDGTTAVLLAVFLGSFGAHKFYLGNAVAGVIYLLFSWTYIPGILGIIEAFTISKKVELNNIHAANEVAALLGAFSAKEKNMPLNF